MEWDKFFSESGKKIQPSLIRQAVTLLGKKDTINLCGGIPNAATFPLESATFKLKDGSTVNFDARDMKAALQYSLSPKGLPEFSEILERMLLKYHNPPKWEERTICITSGSQEAIRHTWELLVSPGDYVIFPKYVFQGILSAIQTLSAKHLTVDDDEDGIIPESLSQVLSRWKPGDPDAPKLIYVNPNGNNPAGSNISAERRRKIYKIAQKYNLIIVEDDAYYFVNFEENIHPSFLSLDVDCRVIRLDSFSKMFSPGIRLGFTCAAKPFINKLNSCVHCCTQQASSLSQMLAYKVLKSWGEDGFEQHVKQVKQFYLNQKNVAVAAAKKWLTGLAQWNEPKGGLFMWIRILGVKDTADFMRNAMINHKVAILAGRYFSPVEQDSQFIRVSIGTVTAEKIDEAFKVLATLIKQEVQRQALGTNNSVISIDTSKLFVTN